MEKDRELTAYYNTGIAGGKWNGMMQDKHIGYTQWDMPRQDTNPLRIRQYARIVSGFELGDGQTNEIAIPAYNYTGQTAGRNASWIFLPDLGRGKGCMGSSDVMASESGAALEYEFELTEHKDELTVALAILPTQDIYPARGLRIAIQIDDNPVITIDARQGLHDEFKEYTPENLAVSKVLKARPAEPHLALNGWVSGRKMTRRTEVFDNIRWITASAKASEGKHTLRVIMIDPEVVLEQIVINPDNNHYSYFGGGVEL